jgi:hypothetical protein
MNVVRETAKVAFGWTVGLTLIQRLADLRIASDIKELRSASASSWLES